MNSTNAIMLTDNTANPAPLGLLAFGITTVLLNIHNAGVYPVDAMIMAMGIFYGGLAQVIAGVLEAKKNNTFGLTAFTSYGFFWLTLVAIWLMPKLGLTGEVSSAGMTAYLVMWGIFTGLLFIGTLRISRALQFIFASLTLLFFLLALGRYTGSETINHIAGIEGIICGGAAIYTGIAQLLNELYGKTIWPVGHVK